MTNEEFISLAIEKHGDRYDYSKTSYEKFSKKVTIICKKHGEFLTFPHIHLKGSNCIRCAGKAKLTTEEFIVNAKEIHGDKYDYSKVDYKNNSTKVEVVCPKHGSFFTKPNNHVTNKSGCPGCAGCAKSTLESFIYKSQQIHGDKYDYSKVIYKGVDNKVEIICHEHGSFWQIPYDHVKGRGCVECGINKCAISQRITLSEFIEKSTSLHGNKFDYSKVILDTTQVKVEIICPTHGSFWQVASYHTSGYGCSACAGLLPITKDIFIERSISVHGDKYDYSNTIFKSRNEPVTIRCKTHGEFSQMARFHMDGSGCQKCWAESTTSAGESEVAEWLIKEGFKLIRNDRETLNGFELDIFIPDKNIGIEYNGSYWHSDGVLTHSRKHETKALRAEKIGIKIITIWDFDWELRKDFIKRMILHRLGNGDGKKINARDCESRSVNNKDAADFYDKTHIQGASGKAIANYGLFKNDVLVACMSFSQGASRRGKSGNSEWELSRYSTNGIIRGGASKLFSAFKKEHNPDVVWSFSDRQHFGGDLYTTLGFIEDGRVSADYRVYHQSSNKLWHKSAWQRKHIPTRLTELGINEQFNPLTDTRTEREMQSIAGVLRIMDAGKVRWKWSNSDHQ